MKYILPILLCLPLTGIWGQSNDQYIMASQGGYAAGKTMSISWTIGDLATSSENFGSTLLTQGFQQPFISIKEINPSDQNQTVTDGAVPHFNAQVYPNPFQNEIIVEVDNDEKNYTVDIIDLAGRLVSTHHSDQEKQMIHVAQLPPAQYTLRISLEGAKEIRTYKILKSN